jgi:ketosteroid isomerase-like protein
MAALYASDGVLISPRGPIVRGRDALTVYYTNRFASGARSHAIKVSEVHVQGDGGYGIAQFSVTVPGANGELHDVRGTILAVYHRDPDGWHLRIVEPSVPEK